MKVYQIYHNDKWLGYNNARSHKVEYVNRAYVIALYRNIYNRLIEVLWNTMPFFNGKMWGMKE